MILFPLHFVFDSWLFSLPGAPAEGLVVSPDVA